jgi:hypothetical protein
MANMPHCRFQNTVADLLDCYQGDGINEPDTLSEAEQKARIKLIKLACRIAEDYGEEVGMEMERAETA